MTMYFWVIATVAMFTLVPARRAVTISLVVGWLLLPTAVLRLPGLPDFTKSGAISVGLMIGVLIFDFSRVLTFRPHWLDLPMFLWCACPMASSLSNGLGAYDGVTGIVMRLLTWGIPYLAGRLYFRD